MQNKVAGGKLQLDGQFSLFPTAVECPVMSFVRLQNLCMKQMHW